MEILLYLNRHPHVHVLVRRFFVREAIQSQAAGQDRCDYVIIVQQDRAKGGGPGIDAAAAAEVAALLPDLPANARYVNHTNECYDWGTFGWLLGDSGQVSVGAIPAQFMDPCCSGPNLLGKVLEHSAAAHKGLETRSLSQVLGLPHYLGWPVLETAATGPASCLLSSSLSSPQRRILKCCNCPICCRLTPLSTSTLFS